MKLWISQSAALVVVVVAVAGKNLTIPLSW
jgi:hypothetical protein